MSNLENLSKTEKEEAKKFNAEEYRAKLDQAVSMAGPLGYYTQMYQEPGYEIYWAWSDEVEREIRFKEAEFVFDKHKNKVTKNVGENQMMTLLKIPLEKLAVIQEMNREKRKKHRERYQSSADRLESVMKESGSYTGGFKIKQK